MKSFKDFILDISEAVGDPLTHKNVIPLDKESIKNLRSTMAPSGPPPMKPTNSTSNQNKTNASFLRRMIKNTLFSPL